MRMLPSLAVAALLFQPTQSFAGPSQSSGAVGISVEFPFGPLVTRKVEVGGPAVRYSTRLPGSKTWYNITYQARPTPAGNMVEISQKGQRVSVSKDGALSVTPLNSATTFAPYGVHEQFDIVLKVDPKAPLVATGTVVVWKKTT